MNLFIFLLFLPFSSHSHAMTCAEKVSLASGEKYTIGDLPLRPTIGTYFGVPHGTTSRYLNGLLARISDGGILFGVTDYIAGAGHEAIERMFLKQLATQPEKDLKIVGFLWGGELEIKLSENKVGIYSVNETTGLLAKLEAKTGIKNNKVANVEIFLREHIPDLLGPYVLFTKYDKDRILGEKDLLHLDLDLNAYILRQLVKEKRQDEINALIFPMLQLCALEKCSWEQLEERILGIKKLPAKEAFTEIAKLKKELESKSLEKIIEEIISETESEKKKPNFKHDALGTLQPFLDRLYLITSTPPNEDLNQTMKEQFFDKIQEVGSMAILFFEKVVAEGVELEVAEKISDMADAISIAYGLGLKYRANTPEPYSLEDLSNLRKAILQVEGKTKAPKPSDFSKVITEREFFQKTFKAFQHFNFWMQFRRDFPEGFVEVYHLAPAR